MLFWWSCRSNTAGAKIIKEELLLCPVDSTCCANLGKALGETSVLAGWRTGVARTDTFFWYVIPLCMAPGNGSSV